MRLELRMDPDDAGSLPRLWPRTDIIRPRPLRRTWHDSPDHALADAGLALAETREGWEIEALAPGPPATPAPMLEHAADRTGLRTELPDALTPAAAFQGRESRWTVTVDSAPVAVTLRSGLVRSVTAEHRLCRVVLEGAEDAVLPAALRLAGALRATPAPVSLAAEALALTGVPFHGAAAKDPLPPEDPSSPSPIADAFRHALGRHLLALLEAEAGATGSDPEPVHQMRVAIRRARSALSVFRPALPEPAADRLGAALRTLGERLAPTREWDVFVTETLPPIRAAVGEEPRLDRLTVAAERRRRERRAELRGFLDSAAFRETVVTLAWFAAATGWSGAGRTAEGETEPPPMVDFAAAVLQKRWKRLAAAGKRIHELDIPELHALRLRAKRMRHAAELFAPLFPGRAADRFIRRAERLQHHLGVLNDAATARGLLDELGPAGRHAHAAGLVLGYLASQGALMRPEIVAAWEKMRRADRFWA